MLFLMTSAAFKTGAMKYNIFRCLVFIWTFCDLTEFITPISLLSGTAYLWLNFHPISDISQIFQWLLFVLSQPWHWLPQRINNGIPNILKTGVCYTSERMSSTITWTSNIWHYYGHCISDGNYRPLFANLTLEGFLTSTNTQAREQNISLWRTML